MPPRPPAARWITARRVKLNLSQQQAAIAAGISLTAMRNYERRGVPGERVQPQLFERIAGMLRVDIEAMHALARGKIPDASHVHDITSSRPPKDARLAKVVSRWPSVPEHVKAAIVMLVNR